MEFWCAIWQRRGQGRCEENRKFRDANLKSNAFCTRRPAIGPALGLARQVSSSRIAIGPAKINARYPNRTQPRQFRYDQNDFYARNCVRCQNPPDVQSKHCHYDLGLPFFRKYCHKSWTCLPSLCHSTFRLWNASKKIARSEKKKLRKSAWGNGQFMLPFQSTERATQWQLFHRQVKSQIRPKN